MKSKIYNSSIIYTIAVNTKSLIISTLLYFFRIFPIKNNRILIISYYGKEFGDNGKYVANQLINSNKEYEIFWALNNINAILPNKIKKVKYKSLKYYYIIATSKIWINNCRFPKWIQKRKRQYYFQLWHGNIALKRIEFDAAEKIGKHYIDSAIKDNKNIDFVISNGTWCTNVLYRGAFRYKKDIYEFGTPRNDILVNIDNKIIKKVKEYFKIKDDTMILLYAPTFRKNYNGQYNINFEKVLNELQKKYKCKYKVLLKLHPNVRENAKKYGLKFNDNVIDASMYDDMQELISASNYVITDYSSVMFDAMIAKKIVVLYVNDMEEYKEERGTYFELEELPFSIAKTNSELIENIYSMNDKEIFNKYDEFSNKIGLIETGDSCKQIKKIIEEIIYGKDDK